MDVAKNNSINQIDDETDEFEVISREDDENDAKSYDTTYKQHQDEVASTVCDEESGLDQAENSAAPSRCESLLHSMCSMNPFSIGNFYFPYTYCLENPQQYDKFLEVVKEESEKNRSVLEQIASMVAQLTKEKNDNTELRAKVLGYEIQIKKMEETLAKLNSIISDQETMFEEKFQTVNAKLNESSALNARKDARIAELTTIVAEKDLRILSLEQESQAKAEDLLTNGTELEELRKKLEKQQRENASQAEIIRLLQEELVEGERDLQKARKDYRDRLDEISEQWERSYRAEVNH